MKKSLTTLAAIAFVGAISATAFAGPVGNFDEHYLDEHPEVAEQLARDPHMVDNAQFLSTHPGLDGYLSHHPEVRGELLSHPDRFMAREGYYDAHHDWHYGQRPLATTDRYMDRHPEVAEQLEKHPGLIDNPNFMAKHPELREYLANHPGARHDWKSHPYRYMRAENRYDQKH